ncbi:MAG: VanW family protein [Clostridia bacterium]|nr:VanW family protein [Clostridia bacterium]
MDNFEKKTNNMNTDTTADTKVFHVITKEDIQNERKKQAIKKENGNCKPNTKLSQSDKQKNGPQDHVQQKNRHEEDDLDIPKFLEKPKYNNYQERNNNKNLNDYKANLQVKKDNIAPAKKVNNATGQTSKVKISPQQVKPQLAQVQVKKVEQVNNSKSQVQQKNNLSTTQKVAIIEQPKPVKPVEQKQQTKTENKKTKKVLVILLTIIIIALLGTILSTVFGTVTMNSNKIIKGVKVNNIDLSGLTKEEAYEKLDQALNNSQNNVITVKRGDYSQTLYLDEIDGRFDIEQAVASSYSIGREGSLVQNNYKTIWTLIAKNNIESELICNDELVDKKINEISINLPGVALDATYIIEGDKLIIKNGTEGLQIQRNQFKQNIAKGYAGLEKNVEIPVEHTQRKEIDIDAIHKEIYMPASDAYYTTNPRKVCKEKYGLDFAITIEQAKAIIKENKEEYEIPIKKLEPKIKLSDLDNGAFPDVLSRFTTYYGTADVGRNANIALAAKSINSAVLMPGETFSFNDLIGECSTRTGYKESTIYMNGELSTGIGGGICQVSTTLYNAVLRSNLEIVERRNHSLGVTYVPAGHDAMVSIGSSDFKFKNNRDYPVKVVAYVGTGSITCEIQGLKQDVEYEVKLESKMIEKTDEKYKVETYKVLYLNGKEVSRTWLSKDTYKYHQ